MSLSPATQIQLLVRLDAKTTRSLFLVCLFVCILWGGGGGGGVTVTVTERLCTCSECNCFNIKGLDQLLCMCAQPCFNAQQE